MRRRRTKAIGRTINAKRTSVRGETKRLRDPVDHPKKLESDARGGPSKARGARYCWEKS